MFPLKNYFSIVKYCSPLIFLYCPTREELYLPVLHSSVIEAYYFVILGSLKAMSDGVEGSPPKGG